MNRRLVAGVVGAALAVFLIWFLALRDRGDHGAKPAATGSGAVGGRLDPRGRAIGGPAEVPAPSGPAAWNADPIGTARLEGQVLDDHDDPVKGAEVWLSSAPPRSTSSGDDGSFAFERLVDRTYSVTARSGDLFGGPVIQKQLAEQVVIRMSRGATVSVHVLGDGDAAPIRGAAVELAMTTDQTSTTDGDGVAVFHGVRPGWVAAIATATGFAPSEGGTLVGTGAPSVELTLLLHKGAAVSGRVVDDKGQPVAHASVTREDAGRAWDSGASRKLAVETSDKGEFAFAVVPPGSFRFLAQHETLAPASSTPVTVDGIHATQGIEIVMRPGGVLTGKVVTKDASPAAYASVSVAPKAAMDFQNWGGTRQITADEKGEFVIRGLPRQQVRVRAESEVAASGISDVDLSGPEAAKDVTLVLDVSGTIAGIVVDSAGQPVPEAQVVALKDLWGGDMESYALSGFSTAITDGGGAFTIRGLDDGEYQLSPHRRAMGPQEGRGQKGTTARAGATNVRLVLASPGSIKGKLVLASGGVPKLATVSISWRRSTPAIGGEFVLDDIDPGHYDLRVVGPEFAEQTKRDLEVTAGKATDAGTIKLERGRRLIGTVVDGNGAPVPGVTVRVGRTLFSEGGKAGEGDANLEQLWGLRTATTGTDGGFAIVGISKDVVSVVAEHAALGRSDAVKLAAGTSDPPAVKLVLHGFGSIVGVVTSKGQPLQAMVMATPKTGSAQFITVQSGPDGAFVIDKVAEGAQRLTAMRVGATSMSGSEGVDVQVKAGARVTQNLDIPAGDLTLEIVIKPKAGATLDAAQVFLFRGVVAAKTGKDLQEAFTTGGASAGGMQFWMGQGTVKFDETLPGRVSICSVPITGDLRDPTVQQRLQRHGELLAVYCMSLELPASPTQQSYPQELPAMTPLPED